MLPLIDILSTQKFSQRPSNFIFMCTFLEAPTTSMWIVCFQLIHPAYVFTSVGVCLLAVMQIGKVKSVFGANVCKESVMGISWLFVQHHIWHKNMCLFFTRPLCGPSVGAIDALKMTLNSGSGLANGAGLSSQDQIHAVQTDIVWAVKIWRGDHLRQWRRRTMWQVQVRKEVNKALRGTQWHGLVKRITARTNKIAP